MPEDFTRVVGAILAEDGSIEKLILEQEDHSQSEVALGSDSVEPFMVVAYNTDPQWTVFNAPVGYFSWDISQADLYHGVLEDVPFHSDPLQADKVIVDKACLLSVQWKTYQMTVGDGTADGYVSPIYDLNDFGADTVGVWPAKASLYGGSGGNIEVYGTLTKSFAPGDTFRVGISMSANTEVRYAGLWIAVHSITPE